MVWSGLRQAERLTAQYGADLGTVLTWAEATQADHLLCPRLTTYCGAVKQPRTPRTLIEELSQFFTPGNQRVSRLVLRHRIARLGTAEPRSASSAPCSFSDHDLGDQDADNVVSDEVVQVGGDRQALLAAVLAGGAVRRWSREHR
ncbi:hypothetical protein [Streptomyces echinatus]|uniref:Uncharacterized protein n=1 Tax=Streptomyces echinatus TaxID=67293 RepID=A0A7W9PPQ9_9ACTN|nr:hypothetical protein [Streptomyces echinatus]MBB5925658.1 hypothetical protein [Streptomyces echinatus]